MLEFGKYYSTVLGFFCVKNSKSYFKNLYYKNLMAEVSRSTELIICQKQKFKMYYVLHQFHMNVGYQTN